MEMLSKKSSNARDQLEITIDQLVPQDHLVRKLEAAIDFSFIYDRVKDLYSKVGHPSIDAVLLSSSHSSNISLVFALCSDNQGNQDQYGISLIFGIGIP